MDDQDITGGVLSKAPQWIRHDLASSDRALRIRAEKSLAAMIAAAVKDQRQRYLVAILTDSFYGKKCDFVLGPVVNVGGGKRMLTTRTDRSSGSNG